MTFHRAFDVAQDAFKAVEIIKELGFSRLLTSGQVCTIFEFVSLYIFIKRELSSAQILNI